MSEQLIKNAYAVLDDSTKLEEEQVDAIEGIVRDLFPDLQPNEIERLVLDVLMAHHRGIEPSEAARSQVIARSKVPPIHKLQTTADTTTSTSTATTNTDNALTSSPPANWPQPTAVVANLKPFDQLRNLFGWENSDEDIERVLAHNDFDIYRTISLLAGGQAELEFTKEQMSARIMCRYFINGNCVRGSQCMYSHDGSTRICRFWLHQRCYLNSLCLFLHSIPQEALDKVEDVYKRDAFKNNDALGNLPALDSLPKLGAKKTSKKNAPQPKQVPTTSVPSHGKLRPIKEVLGSHRGLVPLTYPRFIPWKTPEYGKNGEYCALRKQATADAEQRNKLLQQSTDAWAANDAARAKDLSARGRLVEEHMIECYRQAADLLWEQREVVGSEVWLDLHGIDLGDAVSELENKLESIASVKYSPRPLYIITGRGHFKAKKYADQMSQYIVAYLDTHGFKHKDFGVDPMYGRITAVDPWSKIRD